MIANIQSFIHNNLFTKHNFCSENYEIRSINLAISQRRTRYNLQVQELKYNNEEEYLFKDIRKQLSYSILKEICPLYDSIPFIPFFSNISETKRFNLALEEKLNIFITNEAKLNKDNRRDENDDTNFFTKSLNDILDTDVFVHQPLESPPSQFKIKANNNLINKKPNIEIGVNDSIEEITRFIVLIQYSEDVRNIDRKKKTQVDFIKQHSSKILENYLNRQESRKITIHKANIEVNEKAHREEVKYENKIIEETKREIRKKKFKQTKTFLLRFNQEAKKIKERGKIFSKILGSLWEKKSSNIIFTNNELSSCFSKIQPKKIMTESSDRIMRKTEYFNSNKNLNLMRNKYQEINSQQRPYRKISLNKSPPLKTHLSRNQPKYHFNTSVKSLRSSQTNFRIAKQIFVFNKGRDNSQSNKSNNNISNIIKSDAYKNKYCRSKAQ